MNNYFRELVSQHPLYLAMCRCVEDELEMYDYHEFFPGWGETTVIYRMLIQELFKVERLEVEDFTRRVQYAYQTFVFKLGQGYPQQMKRFFRLVLSLPMCEYEIKTIGDSTSSSGSRGSSNNYNKQFPQFRYDDNYLTRMEDNEVGNTIREIISQTENQQTEEALANFAFNRYELISPSGSLEDPYKLAFRDYLIIPICSMLNISLDILLKVETERPATWHRPLPFIVDFMCRTDIVISKESLVYCVTEVKKYPLLPSYNGVPLDGIRSIFTDQKEIMKQLICELLYFKTDKGILTDSYTVVFVELDLDSFERNVHNLRPVKTDGERKIVPIKYLIRDCHSAKPTLRESLLAYIYKSVEKDSDMIVKQERVRNLEEHLKLSGETLTDAILSEEGLDLSEGSRSRPSTRSTNISVLETVDELNEDEKAEAGEISIDVPHNSNNYVLMQNSDAFNTQLVKLEVTYFKDFLLEQIDDNETLVAKVYDPRMANVYEFKGYTIEEKKDICYEWCRTERACYSILSRDSEFNSCYVRQKIGQIMVTMDKLYVAKGYCNIFRYIEKVPLPKDQETYEKAKKQLEVIHRNRIIHRDIREDNILCTKEGHVYIIDFALAKPSVNIYDNGLEEQDLLALERVFV